VRLQRRDTMTTTNVTIETLRTAYTKAEIAWDNANRALYRAEVHNLRGLGLARYRERAAWEKRCATLKALREVSPLG
jgi:hypothetical protein